MHGGHILDVVEFSDLGMELFEEIDEKDTWDAADATTTTMSSHYEVDMSSGRKTYTNTKMFGLYHNRGHVQKHFIPVDRVENQVMKCARTFSLNAAFISRKNVIMNK